MEFLKILIELTKDKRLTRTDICVMAVIVTYAQYGDDQTVELSANDIHEQFETIPTRTIQWCISHLEKLNYIQVYRQPPKKNRYKVLIPIPEIKAKPTYQKKPSNKIQSSDDFITEAKRVIAKNPFLQ